MSKRLDALMIELLRTEIAEHGAQCAGAMDLINGLQDRQRYS